MYKQFINSQGQVSDNMIIRITDSMYIPFDTANTDYQEYLKWVAKGNQPLPADEV